MNYLRYLFFYMLLSGSVTAQDKSEYTYQPFIMDGTCEWQSQKWSMGADKPEVNRRVISNEDSVYQGRTYKIIYDYLSCTTDEGSKVYVGLVREEDKKVYFANNDFYSPNEETLLYDFNLTVGEEFSYGSGKFTVSRIDTILVEEIWRRAFYFTGVYSHLLEGIGTLNYEGIIRSLDGIPTCCFSTVECIIHGNDALYKENSEVDCPCSSLSSQPGIEDAGKISYFVRDRQLCIHASDQAFTTLKIYTSDGKLVKSVSLREQTDEITSSLEGLTPGSYLFIVGSSDSQQFGQFVVR